jgi:hypothetical protein
LKIIGGIVETVTDVSIDPCVAKEYDVKRTKEAILRFEQSVVKFNTEVGPSLKSSANELIGSLSEFKEPALMTMNFGEVKVTAATEPALSEIYQTVTE